MNRRFCRFSLDFFIIFLVFSHKIQLIAIPNIFQKSSEQPIVVPEKRVIFHFSCLIQYFYSFARSFIRMLVRSFVFSISINVYVFSLCLTFIFRQVQSASSLFELISKAACYFLQENQNKSIGSCCIWACTKPVFQGVQFFRFAVWKFSGMFSSIKC